MGLIYNPYESRELVGNFLSNIEVCEQILTKLRKGNERLLNTLESNQLSGDAFSAATLHFMLFTAKIEMVATSVLQELKTNLRQYEQYTSIEENEVLDEDKLNQQLHELKLQMALLTAQYMNPMPQFIKNNKPQLEESYNNWRNGLAKVIEEEKSDISKVEDKLKRLYELNNKTLHLFDKNADQDILKIEETIKKIYVLRLKGSTLNTLTQKSLKYLQNGVDATGYMSSFNVLRTECIATIRKIRNGTWKGSSVRSTKDGLKTMAQVNGDIKRVKIVKGARALDQIINGDNLEALKGAIRNFSSGDSLTSKVKGVGKGIGKGVGVIGAVSAGVEGVSTYLERREEDGDLSAAVDGVAYTGIALGSICAGAAATAFVAGAMAAAPVAAVTVVGIAAGALVTSALTRTGQFFWEGIRRGEWKPERLKFWEDFALWKFWNWLKN